MAESRGQEPKNGVTKGAFRVPMGSVEKALILGMELGIYGSEKALIPRTVAVTLPPQRSTKVNLLKCRNYSASEGAVDWKMPVEGTLIG